MVRISPFPTAVVQIVWRVFFLSLVTYLLWRQLGLKKSEYCALFKSEEKIRNDDVVLKLLKIFIKEKKP